MVEREPVCLGCAWDHYKDQYDDMAKQREWPTRPRSCHVCHMVTEMGYSVEIRPINASESGPST